MLDEPAGHPDLRHRVGYVTQEPAVYGDLSVRHNLSYFAEVLGTDRARVDEVVRDVALAGAVDMRVDTLSGGQRARVWLAAALLSRPELLVLDEPPVGLDPVQRRDLWAMFAALASNDTTLLVGTTSWTRSPAATGCCCARAGWSPTTPPSEQASRRSAMTVTAPGGPHAATARTPASGGSHAVTVVGSALLVAMVLWGAYGLVIDVVSVATDTSATVPLSP